MKVNKQVAVKVFGLDNVLGFELATVRRVTKEMQPLPPGYVPVRFAVDGAKLLVHKNNIMETVEPATWR